MSSSYYVPGGQTTKNTSDTNQSPSTIKSFMGGVLGGLLIVGALAGYAMLNPNQVAWFLGNPNTIDKNVQQRLEKAGDAQTAAYVENALENYAEGFINEEDQVVQVVQNTQDAVVSIIVTKDVPVMEQYYEDVPIDGFGFGFPFQYQVPRYRENGTEKKEVGGGTGFFVTSDGLIATNRHVVSEEDVEYTVFTNAGESFAAEIVARDKFNDVAILRVEGDNFPFLEFADSESVRVGQTVIAIGNALGEFRNTVSKGVVSGLLRSIVASSGYGKSEQLEGVLQTDAAINPGNSGGPLLDLRGQVIGVNVAVAGNSENIGFALPSNMVKKIVESVKAEGRIIRPFLGVRYIPITEELLERNEISVDYGVLVMRGEQLEDLAIVPGSPADKAGLQENDIILEIDGVALDVDHSLSRLIAEKSVGDTISLKILHKGEEQIVDVVLEEAPQ